VEVEAGVKAGVWVLVAGWAEVGVVEDKKREGIADPLITGGLRKNTNERREVNEDIDLWQRGLWKKHGCGSFSQRDSGKKKYGIGD